MRSKNPAMPPSSKTLAHPNLILGICCLSLLVVSMDVTIVNVALPAMRRDLNATISGLQWVVDAYTLVVASLLMLSGSMADRFGRRRVFQIGMALFTVGSVLCSLAPTINCLVAFRAVQGLGASMLNPVALSIITNTFHEPKARAKAIGVWGAMAGVSLSLGPIIGGALTESIGWRSIFWVNLPIGLLALLLTALFVPESKAAQPRAFDPIGQILILVLLASLTCAVIEGPQAGWGSLQTMGLFAISFVALILFLVYEHRCPGPLLDLRFFRSVPFSSATLIAVCSFSAFAGFLFLNAIYLQQARGFSAITTGLCTLPLALMSMVCAPLSGRMVAHHGTLRSLLFAGCAIFTSGLLLTWLTASTSLPFLLLAYLIFGAGFGMVNIPITHTAISGMPRSQAGVAAAVASTSRQVGASLGVAVAGTFIGASRVQELGFAQASHPYWWVVAGAGAAIGLLGWISSTAWAHESARSVAHLLADHHEGHKNPHDLAETNPIPGKS